MADKEEVVVLVLTLKNESKYTFFYKQSIFDRCPKNCLSFSKKLPQKVV